MGSGADALRRAKNAELAAANEARAEKLSTLPAPGLRWLALAPGWTTRLAEAVQFPTGNVKSFFDSAVANGFASRINIVPEPQIEPETGRLRLAPADTEAVYVMNPAIARDIVSSAAATSATETDVAKDLSAIGSAIQSAESTGTRLDPSLHLWAEFARLADRPAELGRFLLRSVDTALNRKTPAFAEAARCIEAAKPLEQWLHGAVSESLHLAGLRYQLRQRQQDAKRYLERFLDRREQMDAFTSLLQAPDGEWALHYVGIGGVGKTMLMRALQTRVAPSRNASVARIDFDYLEPEYPSTKPALMLLHLAEELRLHDTQGVATGYFESFGQKAVTFHEGLTAGGPVRPAVELIRDPEFQFLLDTFASAVRALPPPVVLILDTCEELAKMLPDGSVPDNVAAAFEMLEGVHRRVPSLRVVFSGRRPLAGTGAGGWRARNVASNAALRPYLRLHEIRGFTEDEATTYLRDKAKCDARLIPSILRQCERDYSSQFHWPSASTTAVPPATRYSPYELALYGSWAVSERDLKPEDIKSSNFDQYIRSRIVGRISSDVFRRLLPALTWLGRFDHATIRALAERDHTDPDALRLIEEVGRQEWVERQQGQFLEIDRGLRWRIHEFFRINDPAGLERARVAAAAYLEALTTSKPVAELDVSHFEAVVRTLESEPERAARWWQAVEAALVLSGMYTHLLPITRRLLADDFWPATRPADRRITAAIAATHAAAQLHSGEVTGLSETWRVVEREADRHPIAATARRLQLLARAARGIVDGVTADDLDEQTAAALVSFAERHFAPEPSAEPTSDDWPLDHFIGLSSLVAGAVVSPSVRAAACLLRGRLAAMASRGEDARSAYQDAFAWSRLLEEPGHRWLHWRPPDDLPARIQLEFVQWAYPCAAAPGDLAWWFEIPPPANIDADRLGAAVLQLRRAMEPIVVDALADFRQQSAATNAQVITPPVAVLRSVPPFYVVAAEESGLLGFVPDAVQELRGHRSALEGTGTAFGELIDSDRACLHLQRRYRLLEAGFLLPDGVLTSDVLEDTHARWAIEALTAGPSARDVPFDQLAAQVSSAEMTHALWNTGPAVDAASRQALIAFAARTLRTVHSDEPYLDMSCRLDLVEAIQVATAEGVPALDGVRRPVVDVPAWWRQHPGRPIEALTLWLRAMALGLASRPADGLVDRVGGRRAAGIAFDEGELLALRLPARALTLLRFATRRFQDAHDPLNALLAEACHALALARLGRYEQLDKPLERIKGNLIASRNAAPANGAVSPVPNDFRTAESWNRIESTVEGTREAWIDVQPAWTHPWLFRIAACLAAHRDVMDGGDRCGRVVRAWRKFIPALPREVAGWLDAPRAAAAPPAAHGMGVEAVGGLPETGPVPSAVAPPEPVGLRAFVKRKRAGGSIFESGEVELQRPSGEVLLRFPAPAPDTEYANLVRSGWKEAPPAWVGDFGRGVAPATLLVDRESAWICWEAVLADLVPPNAFVLRRMSTLRVTNMRPSMERVGANDLTIHTLTGEHSGADLGGSSWRHGRWAYASTPEQLQKGMELAKAQVLHIVGDPIETRAGLRVSLTNEMSHGSDVEPGRGRLVSADEACGLFPNTQLAVIQCPLMRRLKRTGVDREKLGYLRTFAAELYARIPLVVTLPALDMKSAIEVLGCFDRALDDEDRPAAIMNAVREARIVLGTTAMPDEAAFDICFYGVAQ